MRVAAEPAPGGRREIRAMRGRPWWAAAIALALAAGCSATPGPGSPDPPTASSTGSPATGGVSSPTGTSAEASAGSSGMASASESVRVTGVTVAKVVEGFDTPWDLRFLPDGTPLITERPGRIAAVVDGRRTVVGPVPGVVARGEGGLMGLAVDPDFAANRWIYTCFAAGSDGQVRDVRVVRFTLSEGLDALTDPQDLVTGIPVGAGNRHLGCRLEIGPDGMLWITTGDAVTPTAPQDPRSRAGKVLRATVAGKPAPDNPGGTWDPFVYTIGHRNIQGLSFRAGDGVPFSVEHGTGCDDEVNLLEAGANYGWDPRSRNGYAESAPMTSPDIDDAVSAVWSSGCPTIAPSGAEFITGDRWGDWTGRLAVAVLKDAELLVLRFSGDQVVGDATVLQGELGRLRTVRNAPDGSLWLTVDASPGRVVRILPETVRG